MGSYITRIYHFRFEKEGDDLIVTSERDSDFEQIYDWPEDCEVTDEGLASKLHERYYADVQLAFN